MASYYGTNQSISTNPITLAMESTEYQTWLAKMSSDGYGGWSGGFVERLQRKRTCEWIRKQLRK